MPTIKVTINQATYEELERWGADSAGEGEPKNVRSMIAILVQTITERRIADRQRAAGPQLILPNTVRTTQPIPIRRHSRVRTHQ